MTHAAKILNRWLAQQKLRRIDFARQLGMSRSNISHLLSGKQAVSVRCAMAIERASQGAIPAEELNPVLQEFQALVAQRDLSETSPQLPTTGFRPTSPAGKRSLGCHS